jgi:thioredoxin-related protein
MSLPSRCLTRRRLVVAALALLLGACQKNQLTPAKVMIDKATSTAKAEHKSILLLFRSESCSACEGLETFLKRKSLQNLIADNYVLVRLEVRAAESDIENPGASRLFNKFSKGRSGLPYYAVLDKNGKKVIDSCMPYHNRFFNIGAPTGELSINWFIRILHASASKATNRELKAVREDLEAAFGD